MKKLILLLVLFTFVGIFSTVSAQTRQLPSTVIETIYLKDGSIIKGYITEYVPNTQISIKTLDGNVFVYQIDKIEKITREAPVIEKITRKAPVTDKEPATFEQPQVVVETPVYPQYNSNRQIDNANRKTYNANLNYKPNQPGYEGSVEVGGIFSGESFPSFNTVHGYSFMPQLFLGIGVGVITDFEKYCSIPVFMRLQTNILNTKITPFAAFDAGMVISTDGAGGAMLSPRFGVRINTRSKSAFQLSVDYTYSVLSSVGFRFSYIF